MCDFGMNCWTAILMFDNIFLVENVPCENHALSKTQCTRRRAIITFL